MVIGDTSFFVIGSLEDEMGIASDFSLEAIRYLGKVWQNWGNFGCKKKLISLNVIISTYVLTFD